MKNLFKKLIACTFAAVTCFSVAACGDRGGGDGEQVDNTRIQLYVNNFYGGYGSTWLYGYGEGEDHVKAAKELFEDKYSEYTDETNFPGRKGVQVLINDEKTSFSGKIDQILGNTDEVYFAEYAYYYTLLQKNIMLDITDVINPTGGVSKYSENLDNEVAENKTILSKYTDEQKAYYGVTTGANTKYYGIPHYAGYTGLTYNVEIFDDLGAYFKDSTDPYVYESYCTPGTTTLNNNMVLALFNVQKKPYGDGTSNTFKKSAGPDGKYGNEDDGLPRTFDEFYLLCAYLNTRGENPVSWAGAQIGDYVTYLVNALAVEYEGLDQAKLMFTLDGTANTLGTIQNGAFVRDAQPTEIDETNGQNLVRRQGNYEALKFLQNLLFGKGKTKANGNGHDWVSNSSFVSTTSHMNQQDNFLDHDKSVRAAMLVEGAWWESEATNTFIRMGAGNSKMERKFAFMPLPNANAEEYAKKVAGKKSTLFDHIYSLAFIKSNIHPAKVDIAKDFLRFVYTDKQLVQYTQITNTPKALEYSLNETELAACTNYGKSLMRMKQENDVLYPYSQHQMYMANQGDFAALATYWSNVGTTNKNFPCSYMWEDAITAEDWFTGMYSYRNTKWQDLYDNAYDA